MRIFTWIDRLDQKSHLFHSCIQVLVRLFIEVRWLLESFNISVYLGRPVLCLVQPHTIHPFWAVLESLPSTMTNEIQSLLEQALQVYKTLGKNGYYDGELSLDNLGFVLGPKTRIVLIDYGALVSKGKCRPELLRPWLMKIKKDYAKSYQVYKLRRFANGNPEMKDIIEKHIENSLGLFNKWIP